MKKQPLLILSAITLFCLAINAHAAPKTKSPGAPAGQAEIPSPLPETTPASTSPAPVAANAPLKMTTATLGKINHLFFGSNFIHTLKNKPDLADGKIEALAKNLPLTLLRYPGGTVADNFHWTTTTLDNPARFPRMTPADAPNMITFDDFMAFCARTGAEPMLVVNTESWALRNDIPGGIKEAADWVRYCKTKNSKVKYWEIGNETYWHPIMTAREYGALVKRYSQAMKAVDPTIIISANGHWDKDHVGVKEQFPRDQWTPARQRVLSITTAKQDGENNAYVKDMRAHHNTRSAESWWNDVLEECGQDIDMLSVHWYFKKNAVAQIDANLAALMKFSKARSGRDYLLCMSEYNSNSENEVNGWCLAEGVCRMFNGGVKLATFWPLLGNGESARRGMITNDDRKAPRYPWQIFKMLGDNLDGDIIKCTGTDTLFMFATKSPEQITLVVTARGNDKLSATEGDCDIAFDPDAAKGKVTSVCSLATDKTATLHLTKPSYTLKSNGMTLRITPGAFTMIIIKRQGISN